MHADAPVRHPDKFFIDGRWTEPSSASTIEVTNSATEELFLTVAEAQEADVDRAVAAARKAFDQGPWPRMPHAERAQYMRAMAAELDKLAEPHARIWTTEAGALHGFTKARCAGISNDYLSYAALAETFPFQERHKPQVRRRSGAAGARAGRRGRRHRALECGARRHRQQGRPGADRRLHGHRQGFAGGARRRLYPGRGLRGRRLPARRREHPHRRARSLGAAGARTPASTRSPSPVPPRPADASPPSAASASRAARWNWAASRRPSCWTTTTSPPRRRTSPRARSSSPARCARR